MDEGPVKRLGLGRHDDLLPVEPSPIRHPVRLATAGGAVALLIGAVLPWVNYSIGSVSDFTNGIRGDTWGIYVLAVAAGLIGAVSSRWTADSTFRPIQLLPAALGLAGIVVFLNVNIETQQLADSYRVAGYTVSFGPGLDVLLAGSLVCAVGGVACSAVTWRQNPPSGGPIARARTGAMSEWQGCGDFVAELAVGAALCFGCGVVGVVTAVAVTGGTSATPALAVGLAFVGIFVGAILTDRLWRRVIHRR
jgi:hypothetical protein